MNDVTLTVYHLRFVVEAQNRIEFGPQGGAQLRGGLYDALRRQSCAASDGRHDPVQAEYCPVCWLMAREDYTAARGKDVPRAFTVQPPIDIARSYRTGEKFSFGLTLFGKAISLFPYIVLAVPPMGEQGVGYGHGRFTLHSVEAVQPLSGERQVLMSPGETIVRQPTLFIRAEHINTRAAQLSPKQLSLRFLTPTRLTADRHLVKTPVFSIVIARLLERLDILNQEYGTSGASTPWKILRTLASQVSLGQDRTQWLEVHSGSRRTGTYTPISGFVGEATYVGNLAPFREWLLWGQSIQIGKDTVKGNGLFEVVEVSGWQSFNI
jgi:hypothetical protein